MAHGPDCSTKGCKNKATQADKKCDKCADRYNRKECSEKDCESNAIRRGLCIKHGAYGKCKRSPTHCKAMANRPDMLCDKCRKRSDATASPTAASASAPPAAAAAPPALTTREQRQAEVRLYRQAVKEWCLKQGIPLPFDDRDE